MCLRTRLKTAILFCCNSVTKQHYLLIQQWTPLHLHNRWQMQLPVVVEVSANTDIVLCITVTAINATCVGFSCTPFAGIIPARRNTKWWFILNYCKRILRSDYGYIIIQNLNTIKQQTHRPLPIHTKFRSIRKNLLWTEGRAYKHRCTDGRKGGRTFSLETGYIRSSLKAPSHWDGM